MTSKKVLVSGLFTGAMLLAGQPSQAAGNSNGDNNNFLNGKPFQALNKLIEEN
jgi:hypothetical protein